MPPSSRFPIRSLLLFTTLPVVIIGAVLWIATGFLPSCTTTEHARLPSHDGQYDLVTFSRECDANVEANMQATLVPAGSELSDHVVSFASLGTTASLSPTWNDNGSISLTLPSDARRYRTDTSVAGIEVQYQE
jgi:hypothetical protein